MTIYNSNDDLKHSEKTGEGIAIAERTEEELEEPKQYKVILLNDDYTSMDFVVEVLESIFSKSPAEAVQLMMKIHKQGQAVCGIFVKQIAETKVSQVHHRARANEFPLQATMEEV